MTKPKIPITLKVDPDLKTQFESIKEIHELTFSDALEIGMKVVIHKAQSPEDILRRIDKKKNEICNLRNELRHAKNMQNQSEADTDFRWDRDGKI